MRKSSAEQEIISESQESLMRVQSHLLQTASMVTVVNPPPPLFPLFRERSPIFRVGDFPHSAKFLAASLVFKGFFVVNKKDVHPRR